MYELANDELKVRFSSLGGTLSSIKDQDEIEYLWQGDEKYWSGQAPVLFPICGSLRNDRARIGNEMETRMPRHGIVRKLEFQEECRTKDMIRFSVESSPESLKMFPYEFKLYTQYQLTGREIKVTYKIKNQGDKEMSFFIGGHPGFNCPLLKEEAYEDYCIEFEQEESCTVPTPITETGLIDMEHRTACLNHEKRIPLKHELFRKDAVILDELKSRKLKMMSVKTGKGIELDYQDFPYLILWSSSNDGPFVAIEPWVGLSTCSDESDIFEEKRNVQTVNAGEFKDYAFTIKIR